MNKAQKIVMVGLGIGAIRILQGHLIWPIPLMIMLGAVYFYEEHKSELKNALNRE